MNVGLPHTDVATISVDEQLAEVEIVQPFVNTKFMKMDDEKATITSVRKEILYEDSTGRFFETD